MKLIIDEKQVARMNLNPVQKKIDQILVRQSL